MPVTLFYLLSGVHAQDSGSCTLQGLSIGKLLYNDIVTQPIADLLDDALLSQDTTTVFPVRSSSECWHSCVTLDDFDRCHSWSYFALPVGINGVPMGLCRLYDDDDAVTVLSNSPGTETEVNTFLGLMIEYGDIGGSFGLELDCNDDTFDPVCLGTNEAICSSGMPNSPLRFIDDCEKDDCLIGCCGLTSPALEGFVPSGTEVVDVIPVDCFESALLSSIQTSADCEAACSANNGCSFPVLDSLRGGQGFGPPIASHCRLISCPVGLNLSALVERISEAFIDVFRTGSVGVARHWRLPLPGLTRKDAVMQSGGRQRPLPPIMTEPPTTAEPPPTTTEPPTTEEPCYLRGYDDYSMDINVHWGVYTDEGCQQHCTNDALCESWVRVVNDTSCHLKLGDGNQYPITNPDVELVAGPAFCRGDDTTVNRAINSGILVYEEPNPKSAYDVGVGIWSPRFYDCQSLCDVHPFCHTWSYVLETQMCYLKVFHHSITSPEQVELVPAPGVFAGASEKDVPFFGPDLLQKDIDSDCMEVGYNYDGDDLFYFWSPSPVSCWASCRANTQCTYYTYSGSDDMCFLKYNRNAQPLPVFENRKVISGSRECKAFDKTSPLCEPSPIRPDPIPGCNTYNQYFKQDMSTWVDYEPTKAIQTTQFSTWWKKEDTEVDLSNTQAWSRIGLAFVVAANDRLGMCNLSDYTPEEDSCWERANDYFPLVVDLEVVAVAPRSEFSGFNKDPNSRSDAEWTIVPRTTVDMRNTAVHHGFYFSYAKPNHWPVNALQPNNFALSEVNITLEVRDIKGSSPVRPTALYAIFCIWGEPQPEIMEEQPDKHTETCAPPMIIIPTNPEASIYTNANVLNLE